MSGFSETFKLFTAPSTAASTQSFPYDVNIDKNNPAIVFQGTEANAVYVEMREIGGDLWIAQNATFNGTNWNPINATLPAFAFVLRSPNSTTQAGFTQKLKCSAGINPITWTQVWGIDANGTVLTQKNGSQANVLVDGSVNTVNFPVAFATSCTQVICSVETADTATAIAAPKIISKTASGFSVQIPGGANGQTVTLDYIAFGN